MFLDKLAGKLLGMIGVDNEQVAERVAQLILEEQSSVITALQPQEQPHAAQTSVPLNQKWVDTYNALKCQPANLGLMAGFGQVIDNQRVLLGMLNQTNTLLNQVLAQEKTIVATLADVQAAVTAEDTVIDSAVTLIQGLAAQIKALPANQAAIDALAADVTAKAKVLADAVVANTPAAPTP